MKKLILFLLCATMLLSFVACSDAEETDNSFASIRIGNTAVPIDGEAAAILASLGEAKSYDESPSCAFEGMDKIYVYNGFRIQTYTLSGKDYVRSVELLDDTYATPEGVTIGSALETVTAAYGTPTKQTETGLQYVNSELDITLQFLIRDGKVINVQYFKNVSES